MTVSLTLNLGEALEPDETREMLAIAMEEKKPLERVILEAVREKHAARLLEKQSKPQTVAA